jgi:hypothetical protein
MIGLIAEFVNAVGVSKREEARDTSQNICNEHLCSAELHTNSTVHYKLPANQATE